MDRLGGEFVAQSSGYEFRWWRHESMATIEQRAKVAVQSTHVKMK